MFYSLSNGTFAPGHNTPDFSDKEKNDIEFTGFPKPEDENLTDITQVSHSNIKVHFRHPLEEVLGQQKEYVDDEYF